MKVRAVCLILMFSAIFFSCEKKQSKAINDSRGISESEVSVIASSDLPQKQDVALSEYDKKCLFEIFNSSDYIVLDDPLKTERRDIFFAVRYVKDQILDTAVAFDNSNGVFRRLLLIKDFMLVHEDNSILWDLSKGYKGIFGFSIFFSYPRNKNFSVGFVLSTFFDKGERVADDVTFQWNESKMQFIDFDFTRDY